MHYTLTDGRRCSTPRPACGAATPGTRARASSQAIQQQAAELDFAPSFQWGHPKAFELASQLAHLFPGDLDHAFFTNSGSESVDTALKIALAYQRAIGQGTRTRLIGRERGYHGVGFGGISVGGMVKNRMFFGSLLTGVDHLPHTLDLERNRFSRGLPAHGAELADALERLVALHDASTIAAVIVEPVAGSIGVYPPPVGYLRAAARDHREARHPADLRRGDHRLRPPRHRLGRRVFRRHPRPGHDRQGPDLGHRADGGGDGAQAHPRRHRARPGGRHGEGDRAVPRLYLLGTPAGVCSGPGDTRDI